MKSLTMHLTAENLCLYGMPDGQWAVDLPAEEVPPEMPEPSLGYASLTFCPRKSLSLMLNESLYSTCCDWLQNQFQPGGYAGRLR